MQIFNSLRILITWGEKHYITLFFCYFCLDVCHRCLYGLGFFLHFAHFPGSELDIAQSEVGCIVKFTEWPTKEQQSNSVIVSVP